MRYAREGFQLLTRLRARLLERSLKRGGHPPASRAPADDAAQRKPAGMRLVFVQFGDYGDAYRRLRQPGGKETYYAQRYTIDYVAKLAHSRAVESVTVVTFSHDEPLNELSPRLFSAGVDLYPKGAAARHDDLIRQVLQLQPTHLVVSAPIVPLLRWGLSQGIAVLPLFADSFQGHGLRQKLRNLRLAYVLNDPRIRYVANHNLAASLELARIGVEPEKILPYDWPAVVSPKDQRAKKAPSADRPFELVYVGQVSELKGVGDLLHALVDLQRAGQRCTLKVIGEVKDPALLTTAKELGVGAQVRFLGTRPHPEVRRAMRDADAVVVPSHHDYPEGLPMTLYEGLCSRTPLIVSDHPMFALRIEPGINALVFEAGSHEALAARVLELASDAQLYERLSRNAESAAEGYLCPLKWDRLIAAWLDPTHAEAIEGHSLPESVDVSAYA